MQIREAELLIREKRRANEALNLKNEKRQKELADQKYTTAAVAHIDAHLWQEFSSQEVSKASTTVDGIHKLYAGFMTRELQIASERTKLAIEDQAEKSYEIVQKCQKLAIENEKLRKHLRNLKACVDAEEF